MKNSDHNDAISGIFSYCDFTNSIIEVSFPRICRRPLVVKSVGFICKRIHFWSFFQFQIFDFIIIFSFSRIFLSSFYYFSVFCCSNKSTVTVIVTSFFKISCFQKPPHFIRLIFLFLMVHPSIFILSIINLTKDFSLLLTCIFLHSHLLDRKLHHKTWPIEQLPSF